MERCAFAADPVHTDGMSAPKAPPKNNHTRNLDEVERQIAEGRKRMKITADELERSKRLLDDNARKDAEQ